MSDIGKDRLRPLDEIIEAETSNPGIRPEDCLGVEHSDPCTIVIVGATGDLTARKLVPALFNLYLNDGLPDSFRIVGCGRTKLNDQQFRGKMETALMATNLMDQTKWHSFATALSYRSVDYGELDSFISMAEFLRELDQKHNTQGNKIFYLALPPSLYKPVAQMLGQAGLSEESENGKGWSRLVIEKPFGRDLKTAVELNQSIQRYFKEHQIFRIDHYLAKETVQNILMFRFANAIFEPIWNRRYIDHVNILASETLGVEHRAGYYEQAGVIRDMFQNHVMQLLALTAMEAPSQFETGRVRDEKVKFFRSLRPFPVEKLNEHIVLGQYGQGNINGKPVPGYREEPGIRPDSLTPTFAKMKVFIDNWRWQGVPFFLTSGKRLAKKITEITIQFKEIPHSMFRQTLGARIDANQLTLGIYPDEKVTLTFQTKDPGARVCLRSANMDFSYHQNYTG
ncbi:MAG: glucose-6-phosphate dehydrogenase, partial [Deltaproteobacteria bacterium]|nr:glucose-6-phosphate dehydrogenase [Deltaproteobacteria bacterium]